MKVLIVSFTPFFGGGEQFILKLVDLLKDYVVPYVVCSNSALYQKLNDKGIENHFIAIKPSLRGKIYFLWEAFQFIKNLRQKNKFDIILLNGQFEAHLAPFVSFFAPVILIRHSMVSMTNFFKQLLFYIETFFAKKVVAVSQACRSELPFFVRERSEVIYNWIDDNIRPFERVEKGFSTTVLYVGRIDGGKRVSDLLEACRPIDRVNVLIAGDGAMRSFLMEQYNEPKYQFLGHVPYECLEEIYKQADIFVSASEYEAFPLSNLEAMARGLPCLFSDIPAHREISENGKLAILFETGNIEMLKEKLYYLIHNEAVRKELAQRATAVREKFSPEKAKDSYLKLLNNISCLSS